MLGDISKAEHIYIATGYTDMRKSIDGLAALVLVFSDENDNLYKDDEFKHKHRDYYLNDINEDIKFCRSVFEKIEKNFI